MNWIASLPGIRAARCCKISAWDLKPGQITYGIIGPNGCGKTTLLRAAWRGCCPSRAGQVLLRWQARWAKFGRKASLPAWWPILPQTRDIPSIRAGQLVAHGRYPHLSFGRDLTKADREKIAWAMEATGTAGLAEKELSQLSGGERQRVYLAMTLAQDTQVLFLDEPTTYLDIGQKFEVMELVRQIHRMGKTVVMVLHDLPLAFSYSHRVVVLEKGQVAAQGPADHVFESGVPARVFGVQSQALTVNGRKEYLFTQGEAKAAPSGKNP